MAIFVYKTSMTDSTSKHKNNTSTTARNRMMDLLAQREHSELELRKKLQDKEFSLIEIEEAIQFGKARNWIANSEGSVLELAKKTADAFHRKNKGILYINGYLKEKGLPEVPTDSSLELEKALALVKNKRLNFTDLDDQEKEKAQAKVGRLLTSRGFDMDTVRKVVYEEL